MPEGEPIVWRGPLVGGAIQQFLRDVDWGELDYLIIDLPPGTSDAQLTLAQAVPLGGAVLVTTPQEVSLSDVSKALAMFKRLSVPVLGVVENMTAFICPGCGEAHEIFGRGGGERFAAEHGIRSWAASRWTHRPPAATSACRPSPSASLAAAQALTRSRAAWPPTSACERPPPKQPARTRSAEADGLDSGGGPRGGWRGRIGAVRRMWRADPSNGTVLRPVRRASGLGRPGSGRSDRGTTSRPVTGGSSPPSSPTSSTTSASSPSTIPRTSAAR